MGNMVCLNNIIAVCSILGISNAEGKIIRKTVLPLLVYGGIAAVMAQILTL
jgi:lactate permease